MPILQWLFKASSNTLSRSQREQQCTIEEEEEAAAAEEERVVETSKNLVISNKGSEEESNTAFTILLKREDNRACFYSTLQLKHLNSLSLERNQYFWQRTSRKSCGLVSKMDHKAETVAVGCKVLPICDVGTVVGPSNADNSRSSSSDGVEKEAQKRRKAVSRMKELIRWVAASKAGKGGIKGWKVLYFRNKMTLKDPQQDDASSNSSKISFRWDVGSCSTSSVFSPLSVASTSRVHDQIWTHKNLSNSAATLQSSSSDATTLDIIKTQGCNRAGQWITSDSDFVVLEL